MPSISNKNRTRRSSNIESRIARITSPLIDFALPPACTFCTADLTDRSRNTLNIALCDRCQASFTNDKHSACIKCGMPVGPYVDTTNGCPNCVRRNFRFNEVIRLGIYEDNLRTACIRGKSRGAEALSTALADLLWLHHREQLNCDLIDAIVPVPQFWLHWFTRPHHQAVTIAEALSERMNVPLSERAICKTRRTIDQSSLPRSKRLKNLERAFKIRRAIKLNGMRVLIVDDILTTGTTSNEIARVVRNAGASSVSVAVIAVVP